MNLRPREQQKEIGPPSFRYQPNNYIEKLAKHIQTQNPTNVGKQNENFDNKIVNKYTGDLQNFQNLIPISNSFYKNPVALESTKTSPIK